jgi:succinate dehydrogenase / fumarate reductase membrane anchor subunit
MAEHHISTRAGSGQWVMQRVSAMLLVGLAAVHFGLQHFTSDAVSTGLTVAARLNNPYWQAFYVVFIVLAMYHGINGVVGIVRDYNPRRGLRVGAELALWSLAAFFVVLGTQHRHPVPLGAVRLRRTRLWAQQATAKLSSVTTAMNCANWLMEYPVTMSIARGRQRRRGLRVRLG